MMDRVITIVVIACALLLPTSILEAAWAPRAGTLWFVCLASLASAALIAPLQWPRVIRWPLITCAGLALAASNAGLIRLGLPEALGRVTTWASELQAGHAIQDPNLVTFWVTLLIWWTGYSAAHSVASGGHALDGLLPTLVALTINVIYTGRSLAYIIVALIGSVIVMAWTTQANQQARWMTHGIDHPDLWPEWIGSGILLAGLVGALAWTLPTFTSRSTFEWLRDLFNPQRTQAQRLAEQMLGGATPIPLPTGAKALLANTTDLPNSRLIGNPPELTRQVVMWVWTDQPPPLPEDAREHMLLEDIRRPYWRAITYATYTGRGWDNLTTTLKPLSSTLPANLTQRFEIVASHADTVFAAHEPLSGTVGLNAVYAGGELIGVRSTLSAYTITSRLIEADEDTLRQAPISITASLTQYLQLPGAMPRRVRDLAEQITRDATTVYDKAIRIEAYLRTYSYTLDLPPVPEGRDVVDYFLFDAPGGYCDYYASAMVVMLRAVGVPARLASGYLTGAYDFQRGLYRVLGADAHSWPEVYVEGIGWVEFEPTASQPVLARARHAPPITLSSEQVRAAEIERQQRATLTRNMVLVSSVLALLACALVVRWLRRERQLVTLPADEAIPLLYQRLRRRGKWLGVAIRPSDTPDEFIASFNRAVEQRSPIRWRAAAAIAQDCAARIGELYRRASYSPARPGAHEAHQAWSAWRALNWRVWLIGAIGKLRWA